ncbi:hypothetical protein MU516_12680 [Paracoccus sp. YLB-12]|uniref:Uncharacterized protein n=1 Tax=Paracoccus maritimus TaxID=2933292 RepID=A0ABT2KB18_9RHOB|nr:hypothetical protein [Paracoccus sp. YLB-12]MCT4333721.1 hypothetical protein [Paracoccus sp. YLB-12]
MSAWDGTEAITVAIDQLPVEPVARLCFDKDYIRVAEFLAKWQHRVKQAAFDFRGRETWLRTLRGQKYPRMTSYYDFSKIEEISTAASVVIAAEYERGKLLVGASPPAIELHSWSPDAFGKLYEMGFFEVVGLSEAESKRFVSHAGTVTMQIVSGETRAELDKAGQELERLLDDELTVDDELAGILFWINTAVSEALTNVTQWAYRGAGSLQPKRWWLAATLDPLTKNLSVVFYDQGVTIPNSIKRQDWFEGILAFGRKLYGSKDETTSWSDSRWIAAALEYGRSRTRLDHRGKGLPQLADILDLCADGSLRIVSRKGCCYLRKDQKMIEEPPIRQPLMGTLIEWKLSLPERK